MEEVARIKRYDKSTWLVAGMEVRATNVYEALFVDDPRGCYRQCAVYVVLERRLWNDDDVGFDEIGDDFEFYCSLCSGLRKPEHVSELLAEIEPLVGEVGLKSTSCQRCGDVLDVDELGFSSCCDNLLCRRCLVAGDGEHCGACGHNFSPVEILGLLADE